MKNNVLNLKEYELPKESFIGGWYIPEHICDGVIQYYYENENKIEKGQIGNYKIDKNIKDSFDLGVLPGKKNSGYINAYEHYLGACLDNYVNKYKFLDQNSFFNLNTDYNIQKYKKGGGFKKWHFERTSPAISANRVLVFMTYLNDVEDGGTEFYYQNIKTKAEKGLTLIWPTDFTHTHKGIISETKEKYIVTGWYSYDTNININFKEFN
jgi:hypothetical protein